MLKIQLSPTKKIDDALVIWPEQTHDVDIVMDPKTMKIKPGSVKIIYAFDVLGLNDSIDTIPILQKLFDILEPEGELYIIENDFDYITRSYMGGDISIEEFNKIFVRKTNLNNVEISRFLNRVGFPEKDQKAWFKGIKFIKEDYQIIISGKKPLLK